jgi:hypothetical protein
MPVPHRRLLVVPFALAATAALAAGCSIEVSPGSVPAPFSVNPTPSESAGVPKYVCTAAYKILTDGALRLAEYQTGSGDDATEGMRKTFSEMAAKVDAEAALTTDAGLKEALRKISANLTAGAQQSDPKAYIDGEFQTVGQKLDGNCE